MKIAVCVKQVPATNEVKMDPVTNTIIREGVESALNPFDSHALEEALAIKEKLGGEILVISMGIPSVEEMLRDTLALGADKALLLTDRAFAGADTLATAYALAKGIEKAGGADIILCGKMATDGDTAQVGPMLAEMLAIPQITDVIEIEALDKKTLTCTKVIDEGQEKLKAPLPCLITVVKDINIPRLPSVKGMRRAAGAEVLILGAADIGAEEEKIGLKGSPTQVVRTFVPQHDIANEYMQGKPQEQAKALLDKVAPRYLPNL